LAGAGHRPQPYMHTPLPLILVAPAHGVRAS
jgi:hypothetical protein